MRHSRRLIYHVNQDHKYEIDVFRGWQYIGGFHTKETPYDFEGFTSMTCRISKRLQDALGVDTRNVADQFDGPEDLIHYYTPSKEPRKLAKIFHFLKRANFARNQTIIPVDFKLEGDGRSYTVLYKSLQVGRVYKVSLEESVFSNRTTIRFKGDPFTDNAPGQPERQATTIKWHWQIDQDLCRFLEIPYCENISNVSLNQIQDFICFRSYDSSHAFPMDAFTDDIEARSMIEYLSRREKLRRAEWAAGIDEYYPGTSGNHREYYPS